MKRNEKFLQKILRNDTMRVTNEVLNFLCVFLGFILTVVIFAVIGICIYGA